MAREKFQFWLNLAKDDELLIAEQIDDLKKHRLFVGTIRDGIRLVCDLSAGRVVVLRELYPWVLEQQQQAPAAPASNGGLRPMNVSPVAMPEDNDDGDLLDIRQDKSTNSARNFLNSLNNLVGK